jgi:protein TonB
MFESVLEQNIPKRRLGRGAMLSIGVHVLLLGLALYISSRPKSGGEEKLRSVTFFNPPPPPPPPPPPAGGGGVKPKKTEPRKVIKKPDTVVQTPKTEKVAEKPPDPTPSPSPDPAGQVGGVVGGVAGGVVGGVGGGQVGGVVGGTGNGSTTIPFGFGMQKPSVASPADIRCSKDAIAMHVSGVALVKCTVNLDGSLSDCHINKSLPHMDEEIMRGLKTMKFTPVMYQGHPQRVEMSFPLRISGCG